MPQSTSIVLRRLILRMKIHFPKDYHEFSTIFLGLNNNFNLAKKNKHKQKVITNKIDSCKSYFVYVPNNEPTKSLWYENCKFFSYTHSALQPLTQSAFCKVSHKLFSLFIGEGIHTPLHNAECSAQKNPLSKVMHVQGNTFPPLFELGTSSTPACLLKHCRHHMCFEGG